MNVKFKPTHCSNYCAIFIYYTSFIEELVTVLLHIGEDVKVTRFWYAIVAPPPPDDGPVRSEICKRYSV